MRQRTDACKPHQTLASPRKPSTHRAVIQKRRCKPYQACTRILVSGWSAAGSWKFLDEGSHDGLLTPAQAAACFHIPKYLLRKACAEGRLEHRRVVNALWISPVAVAAFASAWRAKKGPNS